ncbi:hypothetical protein Droror1_Dr00008052 [Drosera rotundifolia]
MAAEPETQPPHQNPIIRFMTTPSLPLNRVKKIVKLDAEISKLTSESLFLISSSTELFLRFLADESAQIAASKNRKIVTLEHIRAAVKRHRPSGDFLLDSPPPAPKPEAKQLRKKEKAASVGGERRIDSFFRRNERGGDVGVDGAVECVVEGEDVEDREVVIERASAVEKENGDRGCRGEAEEAGSEARWFE